MTSYKYIGYGVTDSNGVAHLDHDKNGNPINGYTGTGAGEVDVIASTDNPITSSSIVSGISNVFDCFFYDEGLSPTGHHNDNWLNSNVTVNRSPSETTLTPSLTGTAGFYQQALEHINYIVDFDLNITTLDGAISLRKDYTVLRWLYLSDWGVEANTWCHVKFELNRTSLKITVNDVMREYTLSDIPNRFTFRLGDNEEVKYKDFKMYVCGNDDVITINVTKSVIQSTETTNITGKLYVGGILMKNTNIDVYKNGSKVDTVSTGSTGVASYTYTGTGVGECEFQFKYGSIVSETHEVLDATFYDKGLDGTGNHNDNWFNQDNGFDVTRGDSYTLLERKTTGYKRFIPDASSLTSYPFSIGTCIEFKLGTVNGNWNFTIPKTNESLSNLDIGLISDSNKTIKITVGETNIVIEKDGVIVDTKTTSDYVDDDFQCYFIINSVNSLQYRDFKVYPI